MYDITPFTRLSQAIETADAGALARAARADNPWFTPEGVRLALDATAEQLLVPEKLRAWLARYPTPANFVPKNVGIVAAGNLPLVGFFDLLCVVAAGHRAWIKPSSKDRVLMGFVGGELRKSGVPVEPLADDSPIEAVIATGSDNTNRYFRARWGGIPRLLRGSRTSVAVLAGDESAAELAGLARDVFDHLGMGCRSVSRFLVPAGYDLRPLVAALKAARTGHPGYLNAFRHHRALLRMRGTEFIDGGFFTLRPGDGAPEALPDLLYTPYDTLAEASAWLAAHDTGLQCVATRAVAHPRRADFGRAQRPALTDYPDGKDTMAFLLKV